MRIYFRNKCNDMETYIIRADGDFSDVTDEEYERICKQLCDLCDCDCKRGKNGMQLKPSIRLERRSEK